LKSDKVDTALFTHWFEYTLVALIIDSISQRKIHTIIFAFSYTDVLTQKKALNDMQPNVIAESRRTFNSPVPGKNSPYLWKLTVMTLSVV
jgi:hypothetical protein